ncbi:MAG: hypothetical protein ABJN69_09005 [Hellea sp.]
MDHESTAVTPLAMSTEGIDLTPILDPDFIPKPLPPTGEPQNPYMAKADTSVMHSGGWESDTHPAAAVFTDTPKILSRRVGGMAARQCATFTFTSKGYPIMLCGGFTSFQLQLFDPETLERLAKFDLPMRPSGIEAAVKRDPEIIFSDTSSAYVYLDSQDRIIIGDSEQRIRRIGPVESEGKWTFKEFDSWDMSAYLPRDCFKLTNQNPKGECDALTTVMPDHNGLLWWVTRNGRIGSLDPETGKVLMTDFGGEEVQNSFAIAQSGAYVVTDHAMYRLELEDGMPTQRWRLPYDRGTGRKVGSINQGSGTSPSIFGGGKYVTWTDNADDKIAIIVAHTEDVPSEQTRQICRVPIFKSGGSATDNSMIAYDRSIIVENNHGFTNALQHKDYSSVTGGVVRVDVRDDESGCDIVWESDLKVPSVVPKMSLGNGIAYLYSFDILENGDRLWALVGLDFETGKEVIRIPTGTGVAFNNNWASIAIAPNGDTYVGTREGFLKVSE